jgi:hypothetical protein
MPSGSSSQAGIRYQNAASGADKARVVLIVLLMFGAVASAAGAPQEDHRVYCAGIYQSYESR